jgi:hypothetical protein
LRKKLKNRDVSTLPYAWSQTFVKHFWVELYVQAEELQDLMEQDYDIG